MLTHQDNKANQSAQSSVELLLDGAGQVFNVAGEYRRAAGIKPRQGRAYHYKTYSDRLRAHFESAVSKVMNEQRKEQADSAR